jgi:hypothetical protein
MKKAIFLATPHYHMEDNPIIARVFMVSVGLPFLRGNMKLDIPLMQLPLNSNEGIAEIRTAVLALPTRIKYLHLLTTSGQQGLFRY